MNHISFYIGNKLIGSNNPPLIQTMSDIKTSLVKENIILTNDLSKRGLDMMRFSVLDEEDARALAIIKKSVSIPIIADIHFSSVLAHLSLDANVDKIRINPGNFPSLSSLRDLINEAKDKDIAIRIGVNSGSLNKFKGKTSSTEDDILLSLDETLQVFKDEGFEKLVLSLKTSDPQILENLYRKAYEKYPYPLHIGLTESGLPILGAMRSTYALANLLSDNIGDTIRISLAGDRKDELRACKEILKLTGRKKDIPTMIVCPGCGRTLIDLKECANLVQERLDFINKNITVAVMGCPVNGIGEAKDADLGIAGSGKENIYLLFEKGKELGLYQKQEAIAKLFELIEKY